MSHAVSRLPEVAREVAGNRGLVVRDMVLPARSVSRKDALPTDSHELLSLGLEDAIAFFVWNGAKAAPFALDIPEVELVEMVRKARVRIEHGQEKPLVRPTTEVDGGEVCEIEKSLITLEELVHQDSL
ncbi:MAG: hypothetical protein AAF430_01425 [Myxococcota bacterium]